MKLPFTIYDLRFTICKKSSASVAANPQSAIRNPQSQKGIALVITLILLAVTLVMAVAFLALSRRERGAVTTSTDTATARLATDSALANVEAEIIANVLSTTNPYASSLLVSTNYINPQGFSPGLNNVNYDYSAATGNPLTPAEFLENLTNLYYSPRAPVFIVTNSVTGATDFRFYLDLNRNGKFDTNGFVAEVDNTGKATGNNFFEVGDPEWIGVLERPDEPYGPDNKFLARYAFIAVPAGGALDLNYIHNQTLIPPSNYSGNPINPEADAYFRNQGVGSWEINLPAFLADLNTNEWTSYSYNETNGTPNAGISFDDARALLAYRYANNYNTLAPVGGPNGLFTSSAIFPPFQNNIDLYSDGPLQTTTAGISESGQNIAWLWAGSDSTNHFFDLPTDLFDTTKTALGVASGVTNFTDRLLAADNGTSTYDRYTFYRLLGELGTESDPESGKMNLNYDNLTVTNGSASATNFLAWTPLGFFTNAADRMLRLYATNWFLASPTNYLATYYATNYLPAINVDAYGDVSGLSIPSLGISNNVPAFGVMNIPVLVNGRFVYSSAVNRILQLAANMYDATTNSFYPDVFRPIFSSDGAGDVFITGYTNVVSVSGTGDPQLDLPVEVSSLPVGTDNIITNVYGVPWIIGAKKGLPNFNEFSMENAFHITRKLEVTRSAPTWPWTFGTNQMYFMSISNLLGVECWNSYNASYSNLVEIMVRDSMAMQITNDAGYSYTVNMVYTNSPNPYSISGWLGYPNPTSFLIPLNTNAVLLPYDVYNYGPNTAFGFPAPGFIASSLTPPNYLNPGTPPLPQFGLMTTNRLQVAIIDYGTGIGRIIDYVQLNGMDSSNNLNSEIADTDDTGLWATNLVGGIPQIPQGVINQILTSENGHSVPAVDAGDGGTWTVPPGLNLPGLTPQQEAQLYFSLFLSKNSTESYTYNGKTYTISISTNAVQVPFTPTRTKVQYSTWQANDPLVHYLASDLSDALDDGPLNNVAWPPTSFGQLNSRYMPWARYDNLSTPDFMTANAWNMALKDPLVSSSDHWDFPTNKFPTVGWLGRVHRGTPWQTVYLKSSPIDAADWSQWTGDTLSTFNQYFDAGNSMPTNDRLLFDLFTIAPNDNATRGQLSVNVGANDPGDSTAGLAAWSALFSGIVVPPMSATNSYSVISPAGVYDPANPPLPALVQIVQGINSARTNKVNLDGVTNVFEHIGDILSVSALTVQSPYLNLANTNYNGDEMYEWLPQQVMSLLRVSNEPRYVIYCYGQTLKPAPGGIVTGGSNFGMVTNYQVTAESAARAVIRVEDAKTTHPHIVVESFNLLPPD